MPERGAADARLMWHAELDPMTIRVTAQRWPADDGETFDLRKLIVPVTIFKDAAGEEALIGRGRTAVRLSISEGSLLDGPVRLSYDLAGRRRLRRRLLALRQLDALMRLGRVPRPLAVPALNTDRPWMLLRTLEALAANTKARSIAIALFGRSVVEQEWEHESDHLRSRTRRLIDKARRLTTGGHFALVCGDC